MGKRQSAFIAGGVVILALAGYFAYTSYVRKVNISEPQEEQKIIRPTEMPMGELSVEAATEIMAESTGSNPLYDLFQPFDTNNKVFEDPESPCNIGTESLQAFIKLFDNDSLFQSKRIDLPSDIPYGIVFHNVSLEIIPPDTVNYFASWGDIEDNLATFCRGYLGSELVEQFTFHRDDSRSAWYLVDYFNIENEEYGEL